MNLFAYHTQFDFYRKTSVFLNKYTYIGASAQMYHSVERKLSLDPLHAGRSAAMKMRICSREEASRADSVCFNKLTYNNDETFTL